MPITLADIAKAVTSRPDQQYIDAIASGDELFREYGVITPLRVSHFFAQVMHETGALSVLRENMNYSAKRLMYIFGIGKHSAAITEDEAYRLTGDEKAIAERVYGLGNPKKAHELGNIKAGDGYRYRGNGILQITGRANHRNIGELCGVDFETNPELVTDHRYALLPALKIWSRHNLNQYADSNDIKPITKKINGGYIGIEDRQHWFDRFWLLLRDDNMLDTKWKSRNNTVWLQTILNKLNIPHKLSIDGYFGPATMEALKFVKANISIMR